MTTADWNRIIGVHTIHPSRASSSVRDYALPPFTAYFITLTLAVSFLALFISASASRSEPNWTSSLHTLPLHLPRPPSRPGTSILMDGRSEGSLTVDNYARCWTGKDKVCSRSRCHGRGSLITINILPDDALLEIFDCLLREKEGTQEWIRLAHVCRRWRSVVFQSPLRLNLQLLCTSRTRVRETLDIWPLLPLIINDNGDVFDDELPSADNIIAALEHNDRVCQIMLRWFSNPELEYVTKSGAIQKPFPELTHLVLSMEEDDGSWPILPDSFLGGTAPRLRSLTLNCVPFLGLPRLLSSATFLVSLYLDIPRSGYISPEAMATGLSALTCLESLRIHFQYPRPRPALETRRQPPPPLTRSILPSLTKIEFKGASEYLEEILARIDAHRLDQLHITFFNQIIFDTPQLFQFISRRPTLMAPKKAHIEFNPEAISVIFSSQTSDYEVLSVKIPCTASEWQLSSIEQVCTSSLPPVSTLEDLYIVEGRYWRPHWDDDVENTLWLDVLRPFVAVKNLYLSGGFVPRIAPALQELVGGRTTEVFPNLENILPRGFQSTGPIHEGIERFVAARRLTSHPVAVIHRVDAQPDEATVSILHGCPVCQKTFHRARERNRHVESYLPRSICCSFPGCTWTGRLQWDFQKQHWNRKHPEAGQAPVDGANKIYDPKDFVKLTLDGMPIDEVARYAFATIRESLGRLGRPDLLANMLGHDRDSKKWIGIPLSHLVLHPTLTCNFVYSTLRTGIGFHLVNIICIPVGPKMHRYNSPEDLGSLLPCDRCEFLSRGGGGLE